jgi:hypothetical protein
VRDGEDAREMSSARAALARSADGRLRATITVRGELDPAQLRSDDGPPGRVCALLWTQGRPSQTPPGFLACATTDRDGELRGELLRHDPEDETLRRAGRVTVSATRRSVILRFAQSPLGRPARVRFAGETVRADCERVSCADRAPDGARTLVLRLRAGD